MNKGIATVTLVIILGIILLIEYFIVSYFVRFEFVVGRFMAEVPVLSEADKVETYVRSFQNAVELSLLQGIYDIKDQSQVLWYDYEDPNVKMPDENEIKKNIDEHATSHVNEYLRDYLGFIENNKVGDITINPSSTTGKSISWDDSSISMEFYEITFTGTKGDLKINRALTPSGRVRTQFKRIWDLTNSLIKNDEIGKEIASEITTQDQCTVDNINNNILKKIENSFNSIHSGEKIEIKLNSENTETTPILNNDGSFNYCQFKMTLKVAMEDTKPMKYPVYNISDVVEDYLGLIYRIRISNGITIPVTTTSTTSSTTTTISAGSCTGTLSSCVTWQGDPDNCERCLCYWTNTCRDPGSRDCSQFSDPGECAYCGCTWLS